MINTKEIKNEIAALEKKYNKIQRMRRSLPKERLYFRKQHGYTVYYMIETDESGRRREKTVSKSNTTVLRQMGMELYLKRLEKSVALELDCLSEFEKRYNPQEKYDLWSNLPQEIKECVAPVFKTNEQYIEEWMAEEFEQSGYPNSNPGVYITDHGEAVRSRIELIVANELAKLQLPYRYECRLNLGDKYCYPDFTVLHPQTLELWYIEVFGMMDSPEYVASNMEKIQEYYKAGLQNRLIALFDHKDVHFPIPLMKQILTSAFLK